MISIPSAALVIVMALSGCAGATPEDAVDTTTSPTAGATNPITTAPPTSVAEVTTTTVAPPGTTTTEGEPEVLTITGIVIDVAGNLTATTGVTILTDDGTQHVFVPSAGATFHGGPVSHIRDHLLSGIPVVVDYIVLADGTLEAISFDDASHDG